MRTIALALCTIALAVPGIARAECETPYTSAMVAEDLGAMTLALRDLDEETFAQAGARMDAGLACLDELLPQTALASAYRLLGAWHYLAGDKDLGTRWFRTALEVDPAFSWDVNDLPPGHPIRDAFEGERAIAAQPPVPIDGMMLSPPEGTEVYMDGARLQAAKATTGRPHLVQLVVEGSRHVQQGWIVDGNELPESILISEEEAIARAAALAAAEEGGRKKKKKDKRDATASTGTAVATTSGGDDDPFAVQTVRRVRPKAKTPLLITGAVGIVASGVVYGLSFPAHQAFDEATTTDELLQAQAATNTLVIASGATLAVGVGLGVVGIQLDSSPGLVFGRRF